MSVLVCACSHYGHNRGLFFFFWTNLKRLFLPVSHRLIYYCLGVFKTNTFFTWNTTQDGKISPQNVFLCVCIDGGWGDIFQPMDVRIPSSWTQQTQWKPDEAERPDIKNANRWNVFALVIRWLIWWLCSQIYPVLMPTYSQQPPGKLPFLFECLKLSFWLPDAQMTSHEHYGGVFFKLVRVQS